MKESKTLEFKSGNRLYSCALKSMSAGVAKIAGR